MKLRLPVTAHTDLSVFPVHIMSRKQLVDSFEKRLFHGIILKRKIVSKCRLIELLLHIRMSKNGFNLRTVIQFFSLFSIEQRFDSKHITGQEHDFLFLIPNGKGKHAAELIDQIRAIFLVAMQNHLGICICGKNMAFLNQFLL